MIGASNLQFILGKKSSAKFNANYTVIPTLRWSPIFIFVILFVINLSHHKHQVHAAQSTDELDNGFEVTEETHDWNYNHHGMDNTSIRYDTTTTSIPSTLHGYRKGGIPKYGMDDIKYWGCYEYYFGDDHQTPPQRSENYEDEINPDSCITTCQSQPNSIAMIKGNLCGCTGWSNWTSPFPNRIRDNYCNFNCLGSNPTFSSGDKANCGGNLAASVYCLKSDANCKETNSDEVGKLRGTFDTSFEDNYFDLDNTKETTAEDEALLIEICLRCKWGGGCSPLTGIAVYQDYFPLNNPRACIAHCKRLKTNHTESKDYTEVLLGWIFYSGAPKIPICLCSPSYSTERFNVTNNTDCKTPCPGNNRANCGDVSDDSLAVYNLYYLNTTGMDEDEYYVDTSSSSSSPTTIETTTPKTVSQKESSSSTLSTIHNPTPSSDDDAKNTTTIWTTDAPPPIIKPTTTTKPCNKKCTGTDRLGIRWEGCPGLQKHKCMDLGIGVKNGTATWECLTNGSFVSTGANYTNCTTAWYDDLKEQINQTIRDEPIPKDKSECWLHLMKQECSVTATNKKPYFGHEISDIAGLMWMIVNNTKFHSPSDGEEILSAAMDLPGILLSNSEPWMELHDDGERAQQGSKIVSFMERCSLALYNSTYKIDKYNHSFYLNLNSSKSQSESLVTFGTGSITEAKQDDLVFPLDASSKSTSIRLEKGWESLVSESAFVGISINIQQIRNIFSPQLASWTTKKSDTSTDRVVNSNLISLHIGVNDYSSETKSLKGNKARVMLEHVVEAWGDKSQTVPRKLHEGETAKVAMGSAVCVYWDVPKGKWSKDGCRVVKSTRTHTECECDHLTSFAVLMDPHKYVAKDFVLEILTLILCPLSVVCLLMSIIIFSAVGAIQCQRTTITKHLCFCLMIGIILVLFLVDRNYFHLPDGVCVGVGIVTHYIYLAAFVWMAIEGVHLYKMVVYVFDSGRSPTTIYRIMAYGIPVVIIGITCVTGYLLGHRPYGGDTSCWLEGQYVWSFMAPAALVVMGNMIILFVALKTAYQMKVATEHIQARQRTYKNWIRGSFSITVLLGITWLPGFFISSNPTASKVAGYIFVILNSSQGIFLFIFHCFMNEKVRTVAERNLSLPTWLSMPSSHSREPTQSGKRSENMRAYYSETMNTKPNQDSLSRFPQARTQEKPTENPNHQKQNVHVGRTISGDSAFSVSSIDYPDARGRESELRESDSGSGMSTSSQKYLVRGKRRLSYYE